MLADLTSDPYFTRHPHVLDTIRILLMKTALCLLYIRKSLMVSSHRECLVNRGRTFVRSHRSYNVRPLLIIPPLLVRHYKQVSNYGTRFVRDHHYKTTNVVQQVGVFNKWGSDVILVQ